MVKGTRKGGKKGEKEGVQHLDSLFPLSLSSLSLSLFLFLFIFLFLVLSSLVLSLFLLPCTRRFLSSGTFFGGDKVIFFVFSSDLICVSGWLFFKGRKDGRGGDEGGGNKKGKNTPVVKRGAFFLFWVCCRIFYRKNTELFLFSIVHATDTTATSEACLVAPGRNSAKSAIVFVFVLKRRRKGRKGVRARSKKIEKENICSLSLTLSGSKNLTRVEHHVQVQRARRTARNVLSHGELLLFFIYLFRRREEVRK